MVGVAGKSKGCATCRKRKIKCDETRPACRRCENSKLTCDRYERFPVFIDRGHAGYRKRIALEEVKPYAQPQRISSPEAEAVRLIAWFRETHVYSHPFQHSQAQNHWVGLVGVRPSPHPALKSALLAISFTKWGRIEGNPVLQEYGRRQYQVSLDLTQKALKHTEYSLSDDILATTCIMTLYELYDPTCQHSMNWLDHLEGTANLLCLRGPGEFDSKESLAMLEHTRYVFMVKCLATGTPCVFGSLEWRGLPWYGVTKSLEQQILDQGLRLTIVRSECDLLLAHGFQSSEFEALLSSCINICEMLDSLVSQISGYVSRTDPDGMAIAATLQLGIMALSIRLGAAASAQKILTASDASVPGFYASIFDIEVETLVKAESLGKARKDMARKILRAIETKLGMQAGPSGTLSMFWSLQNVQEQLTYEDPEMEQCEKLLTSLLQRKSPFDALGLPLGKHASSPVYRRS